MSLRIDLTGKKYNKLTVLKKSLVKSVSGALWDCVCDCGNFTTVNSLKIRSGKTKSCGCHRDAAISKLNQTHGLSKKGNTYKSWKEMRQRCHNPNKDNYKWYGGRGISVCAEWDDFEVFLGDMGDRPQGKTLDRVDSDGNYCKENCKWSTPKEQAITNRGCFRVTQK